MTEQEAYKLGFCKAAEDMGVNPEALAKVAFVPNFNKIKRTAKDAWGGIKTVWNGLGQIGTSLGLNPFNNPARDRYKDFLDRVYGNQGQNTTAAQKPARNPATISILKDNNSALSGLFKGNRTNSNRKSPFDPARLRQGGLGLRPRQGGGWERDKGNFNDTLARLRQGQQQNTPAIPPAAQPAAPSIPVQTTPMAQTTSPTQTMTPPQTAGAAQIA